MMQSKKSKFGISSLSLAISFALAGSVVSAQAFAADEEVAKKENVEKIAVVGSRAAPRSIGDSPVPKEKRFDRHDRHVSDISAFF